jgi:hypothetical protein
MQFTNPVAARRLGRAAAALVLVAALAGCTGTSSHHTGTNPPEKALSPAVGTTPVVILISVDALNPDAITTLEARHEVPTLAMLVRGGASTFNARTSYEQTNTLPNHTGMLTGRPVDGPRGHHVTFNEVHPGNLDTLDGHYVPGVFDPVHDAGLSTAFYAAKPKFAFLIRSWNAQGGAPDVTGTDDGRDKLDNAEIGDDQLLVRHVVTQLEDSPVNMTFLHLRGADDAGHSDSRDGFMGPKYLDAVAVIDRELGTIVDAIEARPALKARTTIILTADHGGLGTDAEVGLGHRNPTRLHNFRIPLIAWGPGVRAGADLYRLNAGRRTDPGVTRPTYSGPQPIRNLDAADLVLGLFGLAPLPGTEPGGLRTVVVR